jgi:sulfur relay protein TusC/DsrF
MESPHLLVVLRAGPHASLRGLEARDFALAALAFEHRVSLLLLGDGIGMLQRGQAPAPIEREDSVPGMRALLHHGLERIVVLDDDLAARGVSGSSLALPVQTLPGTALAAFLAGHDHCVGF